MAQAAPGTYALILLAGADTTVQVGRLGPLHVQPGFYIYVGSAFGPGGVRARVAHHRQIAPRPHWHIDYLRAVTSLEEVWYTHDPRRWEHQWAAVFQALPRVAVPRQGFGTSDCACLAHLFFFRRRPALSTFRQHLRRGWRDHQPVQVDRASPVQDNAPGDAG